MHAITIVPRHGLTRVRVFSTEEEARANFTQAVEDAFKDALTTVIQCSSWPIPGGHARHVLTKEMHQEIQALAIMARKRYEEFQHHHIGWWYCAGDVDVSIAEVESPSDPEGT